MKAALDPITLEILWTRLITVANEQAAALQRTSFTPIVRESGDLSAAVFDAHGRMLAQAVTGTPATSTPWPPPCTTSSRPSRPRSWVPATSW